MTGPEDFVAVYLDDVIVFSQSLQAHLEHLAKVFACLKEANLKLNPKKCEFISEEVEYLGHIVTPQGLKPNQRNLDVVKEFPVPTNVKQLRQFLGPTSRYQRFILGYAKTAQPLYNLTKRGTPLNWTASCKQAFDSLKSELLTAPILTYSDFARDFVLETDASKQGLGTIFSQLQDDSKLHPLAYASCSLSPSEKNYAVTELETLAVVWAITHFKYHLYGHKVTVYTDHATVKAVLGAPNLDGKHARWWNKVHGSRIREVDIVYRAKHNNCHADALSRQPVLPPTLEDDNAEEVLVALVSSQDIDDGGIIDLLSRPPNTADNFPSFADEQWSDSQLQPIILYLRDGELTDDVTRAKKIVAESALYTKTDSILYYVRM